MALQLTPLHPLFAAEVRGLDLRQTPGPELCAEIDRAMDRYAVLVFRGQELDDDQQMAFGEALGPLETTRGTVDAHKHRLKHGR
jgi:alpha-ketoglutarate-dependent 2,4-dichlorophenoxyacetate dioxygenase